MLTFRETDQNPTTIRGLIESIRDGADIPAIVVIDHDVILDGHHRATAYAALNIAPVVISISSAQYDTLSTAGYDDLEIAAAAHLAYGDGTGADAIDAQFPGAGVYDRACDAAELL
jgi:hypothetical protein